ncbi:enhancer of polycomb homolog 2-like [Chironomus tepperi]|uniref:enhancer of polycomb homolog 2-like n=1 Tax=Chironomus tepperi TaxID=113505 RepID=UPI00391F1935
MDDYKNKRINVKNDEEIEPKSTEIISSFPKNFMEKEELHEKHFQEAIKNNTSIPVPEIDEIDKEAYDKLYPADYTAPKIRIMVQPSEKTIEYDADSEDDEWLEMNGEALRLTHDDFEMYVEFLENKSAETKKVPSITDLTSHFNKQSAWIAMEATYDYWLNKRIQSNGESLIQSFKKEDLKPGVKHKFDPYIAFRPCRERMHLRKNRSRDYENYIKMLDIRESIQESLKFYKTNAFCERTKHELLLLRFATFKDQYNTKSFNSSYLEKEVQTNTEFLLKDLKENRIGCDINSTKSLSNELKVGDSDEYSININEHEMFPFHRLTDCEYHDIRNDLFDKNHIPECSEHEMFYNTDVGVMRRRMGRGGRVIYDRLSIPKSDIPEHQEVDYFSNIYVKADEDDEDYDSIRSSPTCQLDAEADNLNISLNDIEIICSIDS